jgi:hypothetical protein
MAEQICGECQRLMDLQAAALREHGEAVAHMSAAVGVDRRDFLLWEAIARSSSAEFRAAREALEAHRKTHS